VDSALALRRELALAKASVAALRNAEAQRSRQVALLAAVTGALDDSTHLVAWHVTPDGTVRLAGYTPLAARVVAAVNGVSAVREAKLEGPVTREQGNGTGERDRFALAARRVGWP
jgi:hypothetical protein